jgi:hypothetical protein
MKLALSPRGMGANLAPAKARNVVLVHQPSAAPRF